MVTDRESTCPLRVIQTLARPPSDATMGGKSKKPATPTKSDEEKAAEKAAKARAKAATDMLKAAKEGDRAKVEKALTSGVDINHTNERGQTAAHMAAAFGHRKLLRILYAKGADFSLQTNDHNKFTPLTAALFIGEQAAATLIEALIAGKDVDVKGESDDCIGTSGHRQVIRC